MMYPQLMYRDVEVGATYVCPPGGMIFTCVQHDPVVVGVRSGRIVWLVLDAGNMYLEPGTTRVVEYKWMDQGSWKRID